MARTNVEERVFSLATVRRAAGIAGQPFNEPMVLGVLVYVWHDSQAILQLQITEDEYVAYSRLPRDLAVQLLPALIKTRFLIRQPDGMLEVNGNEKQIESLVANLERAKKGGAAMRKKWDSRKNEATCQSAKEASSLASSGPQGDLQASPEASFKRTQFNAIQCNAIQCREEEEEHDTAAQVDATPSVTGDVQSDDQPNSKKKRKAASDARRTEATVYVVDPYRAAFERRYQTPAPTGQELNTAASRLLKSVPKEDAPGVVEFYLASNERYLVQNAHPLKLLVSQIGRWHRDWTLQRRGLPPALADPAANPFRPWERPGAMYEHEDKADFMKVE